ncbi:hypothetical protein RCL1_008423 [Eukaryota sp. TZLM3-RCL]
MKLLLKLLLLVVLCSCVLDPVDVESFLDGVMSNVLHQTGAYAATLSVVDSGSVILKKGYGLQNHETPVSPDSSLFRPGSVSKLFTYTAIMQLVEQNIVSLDDPITDHLHLTLSTKILFAKSSEPIKIRHLMTHSPGLEDVMLGLLVFEEDKIISLNDLLDKFPRRIYPAGSIIAYSNFGVALLGLVIENKSGKSFENYIKDNLFAPLEMHHSTFEQPLPEDLKPLMTDVPKLFGNTWKTGPFEFINGGPAGSMTSTAADMANFMLFNLQNGEFNGNRLLEQSTMELYHSTAFSLHPELNGMTLGFFENTINNKRVISHGGNTLLFHSGLYLLKDENIGLFVSLNGGTGNDHRVIFQMFMDRYFPYSIAPRTPICNRAHSSKYTGEYHLLRSSFSDQSKTVAIMSRFPVSIGAGDCLSIAGVLLTPTAPDSDVFVRIHTNHSFNPLSSFNKVAFVAAPDKRLVLAVEFPVSYVRVGFFESLLFLGFCMVFSSIMITNVLCGCVLTGCKLKVDEQSTVAPTHIQLNEVVVEQVVHDVNVDVPKKRLNFNFIKKELTMRRFMVVYGGSLFTYFFATFKGLNTLDPFFELPLEFMGETPFIMFVSYVFIYLLLLQSVLVCAYCIFAWVCKLWSKKTRIMLTATCVSSFGLIYVFSYAKLL